jgi:mono/diheme cytochrome c family protein
MRIVVRVTAAILFATASHVRAQEFPGDPAAGEAYARRVCTDCHAVSRKERLPWSQRSLEEIAAKPGMTATALIAWLTGISHPKMPNLILSPEDARNVVAYILSLQDGRPHSL